jgi:HK97 family phage major capsid protein
MELTIAAAQAVADEAVLASKRAARVVVDDHGNPIDVDAAMEAKAASWRRHAGGFVGEMQARQMTGESLKSYTGIMEGYFRKGPDSLDHDERKALSVGGDATGGYTVNPDMSGAIVTKIFETSPMRAYAAVQVISKDALEGLFDLNEVGYGWVAETAARPVTSMRPVSRLCRSKASALPGPIWVIPMA